jgi:hypothetical protein
MTSVAVVQRTANILIESGAACGRQDIARAPSHVVSVLISTNADLRASGSSRTRLDRLNHGGRETLLPGYLLAVENELNNRRRPVLNDHAPAELFTALLASKIRPCCDVD